MTVILYQQGFNPYQILQDYESAQLKAPEKIGATSIFIGTMRDFNEGSNVTGMTLEYYPGMTEKQLEKILQDAHSRWAIEDSLIVHRVGDILPKDPIVLVAVWSSHRGDAFDASRFIMEALKSTAPFWKKEHLNSTESRWVSHNTNGYQLKTP